jgi:hypothetical protein
MKRTTVSRLVKGQRVRVLRDADCEPFEGIVEHAAEPGLKARIAVEGMYRTTVHGADNGLYDGPLALQTRFVKLTTYDKIWIVE